MDELKIEELKKQMADVRQHQAAMDQDVHCSPVDVQTTCATIQKTIGDYYEYLENLLVSGQQELAA